MVCTYRSVKSTTCQKLVPDHDLTTIQFLEGLIQRTPDIYLAELQDELEQAFEEVVSKQTIWRSLRARGYTQKKASD